MLLNYRKKLVYKSIFTLYMMKALLIDDRIHEAVSEQI